MSKRDPISERVRDLSTSYVMTSGAGCGKTYRMVERYTALIEAGVEVTRIIAVTFTEKAAAELKARVRGKCREMMVCAEGAERGRWERAARRLAMAPVTTIHGLCARLLRENAVAAGVDPHFRPLDETEQEVLLRDVVRRTLLKRLHAGEESARAIVQRWGLANTSGIVRKLVEKREDLERWLHDPPAAETLLACWEKSLVQFQERSLDEVLGDERWMKVCSILTSIEPVPGDKAGEHMQVFCDCVATVEAHNAPLTDRLEALGVALAQGNRRNVGSKSNWVGREDELAEVKSALKTLADLKDEYRDWVAALAVVEDRATAELAAALCREGAAANEEYAAEKRRRSALDFADLQILARDLLLGHPEILARVRARYDYVLVDEFQDTNRLQKQIIWAIAGGDADRGVAPPGGKLFVVGDAKQSIYEFRAADVTVFNATVREFEAGGEECGVLHLTDSRRSRPALVAFYNDVFGHAAVMGREGEQKLADYEAGYEPVGTVREEREFPFDVEFILISDQEEDDSTGIDERRLQEAEVLAARIHQIVTEKPFQVYDKDEECWRDPKYKDFGILFQAMTSVGIYEYALRRAGVPFYTVAGRGFYHRQEIRDCLSLLSVLENTSDSLSLVGALRSPMFALDDDAIFWLTRCEGPLWQSLCLAEEGKHPYQQHLSADQLERIVHARHVIEVLRAERDRLSLSELIERMLALTGLTAVHLSQFAGRQAVANLRKLTDLARAFERSGEFSLREFIRYLQDLVLTEHHEGLAGVYEETANVVQLLTVHKAKGLEWPIVVVPDLTRDPSGNKSSDVLISPDCGPVPQMELADGERKRGALGWLIGEEKKARAEAERRRLLYVALTRARDFLILSSVVKPKTKEGKSRDGVWLQWLTEALSIDPCEVEHGKVLEASDQWRCRILRSVEGGGQGPAAYSRRAPLSVLDDALKATHAEDAGVAEELVEPVAPAHHVLSRLTVSALQHYRTCPRLFELRHVLGLPERHERDDWLEGVTALERGDLAHRALEIIGREGLTAPQAVGQAIDLAGRPSAVSSRIDEGVRSELEEALHWFIHQARLDGDESLIYRDWVASSRRLRAEVEFVLPLDDMLLEGTIDALLEAPDGTLRILDYKTGHEPSAAQLESYRFQIGLYCAAVQTITGELPADAALVLLDARRVERIDPATAARQACDAAKQEILALRAGEFAPTETCDRGRCALAYACRTT